jgi:two-component system, LuxR family, response regulator FixJ
MLRTSAKAIAVEPIIHVVDDDAAMRRSLERLLKSVGLATECYASAKAILDAAPLPSRGCILVDVCLPDIDGLKLQARLHDLGVHLPMIVITGRGNVATAVQAMKGGAFDFIEKPFANEELLDSVEAALAAVRTHRDAEIQTATDRIARLSRREGQVLDALVAGRPNKAIAYDLGLSVRTVEVHRARMMERLGVRQFAEAVCLAVLARMAQHSDGPEGN